MQIFIFIFSMGVFLGIFIGQQWAYLFGVFGDSIFFRNLEKFLDKRDHAILMRFKSNKDHKN